MKKAISIYGIAILALLMWDMSLWGNPIAPSWRLINLSAPPRYEHRCAYDVDRGEVVLFGGMDSAQAMPGDVWEFSDSRVWNQIQAPGPGGRVGHGLCYDSTAHLTILFGGRNQSGQYLNDTWGWNGSEWTRLDSTGPSPRAFFVMTYDSQRQKAVLFGGASADTVYGDTWEWDGSHWELRAADGPPARINAAMTYCDYFDFQYNCVLFGGESGSESAAFNDTWLWDGTVWQQLETPAAPSPMIGHSMSSGVVGDILFGGRSVSSPDSVFNYTWFLIEGGEYWYGGYWDPGPSARSMADMACRNGEILLIGGNSSAGVLHDVWGFYYYNNSYIVGDVNDDLQFNGLDVIYAVAYFKGGPAPLHSEDCFPHGVFYTSGDVNGSCSFNGLDVTYMVAYLKGGPSAIPCPDCPPAY